jgi:hypothetical protein
MSQRVDSRRSPDCPILLSFHPLSALMVERQDIDMLRIR